MVVQIYVNIINVRSFRVTLLTFTTSLCRVVDRYPLGIIQYNVSTILLRSLMDRNQVQKDI